MYTRGVRLAPAYLAKLRQAGPLPTLPSAAPQQPRAADNPRGLEVHKRGYRTGAVHVAALRETLAAGMLLRAGYDAQNDVLCDPMTGSGTIAIEAALIGTNSAPGLLRSPPALTRWPDIDPRVWLDATGRAVQARRP